MCDTWVSLRDTTRTGTVIFAKNSDRPAFDCQPLVFQPRREWSANSIVRTEYVELPQVQVTYAHLGSSPYWCWGYEEGINEFGVVIGNEAIYTKTFIQQVNAEQQGRNPKLGLLGMDLIRLALERTQSAAEAVRLMGNLIEKYGQFGSGVPTKDHADGGYDNSFLLADPREAWVLEAVGTRWAARQLTQGYFSISNQPTIRTEWTIGSPDLQAYAIEQGWWVQENRECFDFARAYIDPQVSRQISQLRLMRSRQLLAQQQGQVSERWMMRIARDHYEDTFLQGPYFDAADPDFLTLCMHVSSAGFTWGNTASSCVAVLPKSDEELPVFWWTPGPPCNGCYVPFFVHGTRLPEIVSKAGTIGKCVVAPNQSARDQFSPDSYWWLFRQLLDQVKGDPISSVPNYYPARNRRVRAVFDSLEQEFAAELPHVVCKAVELTKSDAGKSARLLDEFTARCVQKVVTEAEQLLIGLH
jgi:secernin